MSPNEECWNGCKEFAYFQPEGRYYHLATRTIWRAKDIDAKLGKYIWSGHGGSQWASGVIIARFTVSDHEEFRGMLSRGAR
jgi:hypothetical protein